jgi:hypothetical protein
VEENRPSSRRETLEEEAEEGGEARVDWERLARREEMRESMEQNKSHCRKVKVHKLVNLHRRSGSVVLQLLPSNIVRILQHPLPRPFVMRRIN